MQELLDSLFGSSFDLFEQLRAFLVAATLVLLALAAGWLLGLMARAIFMRAFTHQVEELSRRLGYKQLEQSLGLRLSLGTLVGGAVQVLVTGAVLLLLASVYYPPNVEGLVAQGIVYLPTLLVALILVGFGLFFGQILADITYTWARSAKRTDAQALSTMVRFTAVILSVMAALLHLGVATAFLTAVLAALLATGTLAFGLSAGLGGADYVRDVLAGRAIRAQLRPGQRVAIGDITGIVVECGPSATLIATDDGKRTLVPNRLIAQKSVVLG